MNFAENSLCEDEASALAKLARLLGRFAARQTLKADADIKLTEDGLLETSGKGAAS